MYYFCTYTAAFRIYSTMTGLAGTFSHHICIIPEPYSSNAVNNKNPAFSNQLPKNALLTLQVPFTVARCVRPSPDHNQRAGDRRRNGMEY